MLVDRSYHRDCHCRYGSASLAAEVQLEVLTVRPRNTGTLPVAVTGSRFKFERPVLRVTVLVVPP